MRRPIPAPALSALALAAALAAAAAGAARAGQITTGEWQVLAIDGTRFAAPASLALESGGRFSGQAPCNRYFGQNGATLPALALGGLGATRMACAALADEDMYFKALSTMTAATLQEGHLILTGPQGRSIELVRAPAEGADAAAPPCLTCKN